MWTISINFILLPFKTKGNRIETLWFKIYISLSVSNLSFFSRHILESAFTLLVPTNDAIARLTPSQTADSSDLKEVLRFYIIPGEAFVSSLANEFQITTTSTEYPFARINLYDLGEDTVQVVGIIC